MKLFIVYAGIENGQHEWPGAHSLALQRVAGRNVLGHVLDQLQEAQIQELALLVDRDEAAISAWIENRFTGLLVNLISVPSGLNPLQALAECRGQFDNGQTLVVLGNHITVADYKALGQGTAGVTLFARPQQQNITAAAAAQEEAADGESWAGVCYFRQGTDLLAALDQALPTEPASFFSFLNTLRDHDPRTAVRQATMCLDTSTIEGLLDANARLLGLGYGTEDAIERSYVEDFTVIPPVFLHETAVIENAVIGPYANVEAGAKISSSIVRNSLIGKQSWIENAVLDRSLIGEHARVQAAGNELIVENDAEMILK